MDKKKLDKIARQMKELRKQGGIKSKEMEKLAGSLGRHLHKKGRGHPIWVSKIFSDLRPLPIPHHSTDLNRNTAGDMLDLLEEDMERHRVTIEKEDLKKEDN